ncbi:ER membrane protein complex subunit 6 isoform X2 [Copidosoma floridanum]|uniref:ER membrane protein complex subunit 6 isoform X2 n=1 Tax=Copidosoma floridanum TaxID=29053 RepID=UPI0006C9B619|nr:ER membrane protein complex subunit 6 isoform X2 [Copidosoma floridanum]
MSTKERLKQDQSDNIIAYSELAIRNNAAVVEYCRISMAALSGGTAGLLGLTGLCGFGFYVFAVISLWVMLLTKAGGQWKKYFVNRRSLLTGGFFGGLFISIWNGSCLLRPKN